ncbi:TPA: DUF262 domain-containing protein [Proteus mirabilis]|nr:DUF262 domain-containing protein [Proteus mirabilis]HBC5018248.1 DUF262 domain-containing protein [Proteus mirabilis]HEA4454824.1 DUF262 domain-containing protein [Proteus mirabilis]HEJ9589583.1 DUF262 domain-containing protein [Proteus mirabilis]
MKINDLKAKLEQEISTKEKNLILSKIEDLKVEGEDELRKEQKDVDFDTKEYTVELIVHKFSEGLEDDTNELFVPDYQRDFVWDEKRQSRLIESLLLGFPIPYIFTADVDSTDPDLDGRVEIVDGSQRIRTISSFVKNKLVLQELKSLSILNGFKFEDLPLSRQRRFNRIPIRVIELSSKCTEEIRRDLFERINSGSDILRDMEVRKGSELGSKALYKDVIKVCAQHPDFPNLAPLSEAKEKRDERLEFALRFFAYLNNYNNFEHSVREFLDKYMHENSDVSVEEQGKMIQEFNNVISFIKNNFPYGFKKSANATTTPRVRFEALSVGTALALRENPNLTPTDLTWITSNEFKVLTTSDGSNSKPKVIERIEYVRNKLLDS